jgi:deoxyadenosine/deoxycytidine kinase
MLLSLHGKTKTWNKKMYILEGNIGVGKSTFLTLLKKHSSTIEVLTEPVENWSSESFGQSLLANFYQDISRWAYTLETLTMVCRAEDHMREQNHPNRNRILERSIYSGHYCFAKNCYEGGYVSPIEWEVYNKLANILVQKNCIPPLGFIYLRATPQVCFDRVVKRNRPSEKNLTLEYITDIGKLHDRFLIEKTGISAALVSIPVLVLDCNEDFLEHPARMREHVAKIEQFLVKTGVTKINHAMFATEKKPIESGL